MPLIDRSNKSLFVVDVLCGLAALFYLPYLVPMHPSASDSYLFSYNDRVGVVLLFLLMTIGLVRTNGLDLQLYSEGTNLTSGLLPFLAPQLLARYAARTHVRRRLLHPFIQPLFLGVIGEYVGAIFIQVQKRFYAVELGRVNSISLRDFPHPPSLQQLFPLRSYESI